MSDITHWTEPEELDKRLHLKKITFFACVFLVFISVLKTDTAKLKLCLHILQAFLVEMDYGDK